MAYRVGPHTSAILLAGAEPSLWPIGGVIIPGSSRATCDTIITVPGTALLSFGLRFAWGSAPW